MAQPLGHGHAHGVAHAPVAVTVGDLLAVGAVAVPVIGETLEAIALPRREASHAGAIADRVDSRLTQRTRVVTRADWSIACVTRLLPVESDRGWRAAVVVLRGAQCWRQIARVLGVLL